MNNIKLSVLAILLISPGIYAAPTTYSWPAVTAVTGTGASGNALVVNITVRPAQITAESTAKFCATIGITGSTTCFVGIVAQTKSRPTQWTTLSVCGNATGTNVSIGNGCMSVGSEATWAQVGPALQALSNGNYNSVLTNGQYWYYQGEVTCVKYMGGFHTVAGIYEPLGINATCTPPNDIWCAPTSPSTNISHGTLDISAASGHVASTTLNMQCSGNTTYLLRALTHPIRLSNGMQSTLRVNNSALGSLINGSTGTQSLSISSTLSGSASATGSFSGQTILMVDYP